MCIEGHGERYAHMIMIVRYFFIFSKSQHWREGLHISVVACGERLEETLIMFKSAVLFSKALLVFHIFAEDGLQQEFKEQVCSQWNDLKLQILGL